MQVRKGRRRAPAPPRRERQDVGSDGALALQVSERCVARLGADPAVQEQAAEMCQDQPSVLAGEAAHERVLELAPALPRLGRIGPGPSVRCLVTPHRGCPL